MRPTRAELGKACVEDLLEVRDATQLILHDAWSGLSPFAPIVASYRLEGRAAGELKGKAAFSCGIGEGRKVRNVSVRVPGDTVSRFLRAIASAPLEGVAHAPALRELDNYQHTELVLYVPGVDFRQAGGTVTFFRPGDGAVNGPWTVFVGGECSWVSTAHVDRALKVLTPHLRRGDLERMTRLGRRPPRRGR